MVIEKQVLPFFEWLFPSLDGIGASVTFVAVAFLLIVLSLFVAYIRMLILQGPGEGFYAVAKAVAIAVGQDFPNTSIRRILAMAWLAVQEAVRRRVIVVFILFAVALLFAGWFLDTRSEHPARLYLYFVLNATEFLILILAVLLSAFSLPADIKSRTIYTITTKPVRPTEIVLGRVLGFAAINTALLVAMCLVSYLFVLRGLSHQHTIAREDVQVVRSESGDSETSVGETSFKAHHRHDFTIDDDGKGVTNRLMDHYHDVQAVGEKDDALVYECGDPVGALTARVPIYGKIRFINSSGQPGEGISVGREWTYRSYIEGGSLAAAVWTFEGIREQDFPEGLPLEMTLSVFRTFKGDIVSGILGSMTVKNPTSGKASEKLPFTAAEYVTGNELIPRELRELKPDGTLLEADLYRDFIDQDGRLELWIQCSEPGQYYGAAQPDIYIRGADRPFFLNLVKAFMGIWFQMVVLTCFGVMFSTFLSGPVAMFASFVTYMIGLFNVNIVNVATGEQMGGGPLESLLRIMTQKNVMIELDMGRFVDATVKVVDGTLMFFMEIATHIVPNFKAFNTSNYVAYGFDINVNLLAQHGITTGAFVLVLSLYGYFFLKSREIAG